MDQRHPALDEGVLHETRDFLRCPHGIDRPLGMPCIHARRCGNSLALTIRRSSGPAQLQMVRSGAGIALLTDVTGPDDRLPPSILPSPQSLIRQSGRTFLGRRQDRQTPGKLIKRSEKPGIRGRLYGTGPPCDPTSPRGRAAGVFANASRLAASAGNRRQGGVAMTYRQSSDQTGAVTNLSNGQVRERRSTEENDPHDA